MFFVSIQKRLSCTWWGCSQSTLTSFWLYLTPTSQRLGNQCLFMLNFFAHENIEIPTSKVAHNWRQTFFHNTGPASWINPELIFHIINMSQDSSVYCFDPENSSSNSSLQYQHKVCSYVPRFGFPNEYVVNNIACCNVYSSLNHELLHLPVFNSNWPVMCRGQYTCFGQGLYINGIYVFLRHITSSIYPPLLVNAVCE